MNRLNYPTKAQTRMQLNGFLLSISMTGFFIIIGLRQELFLQKILLLQQLLSIPLILTSSLAYSKVAYREKVEKWDRLGWITFIIGYAFLMNVVGILIGNLISKSISLLFFAASWLLTIIYSGVNIHYGKTTFKERAIKDLLFISLQLFFGVFVVLKIVRI
jgi:hypothetical protein